MSISEYLLDPWKKSHKAYSDSAFGIRPAPEFATSEVVVSSLYRAVGFEHFNENMVSSSGRELDKKYQGSSKAPANAIENDTWQTILHGVLASPKQSNQSSRRFLQMCPMVPDVNLYSGSARLSGNTWNPGALLQRLIQMGSPAAEDAEALWKSLFDALSVDNEDDAWARWLQEEFERRNLNGQKWAYAPLAAERNSLSPEDKQILDFPAQQFVIDLKAVISAKSAMTRKQWISLLESVVRVGAVSHVLWLASVNARIWECALAILNGQAAPTDLTETRSALFMSKAHYLTYGNVVMPTVRNITSAYLSGRLGCNVILWHLEQLGVSLSPLNSAEEVQNFLSIVDGNRNALISAGAITDFQQLVDEHARTLACKKGIGSNLMEFCRYSLGKRQTAETTLRSYDQSYFFNKRSPAKSAPWIVSLGPVALLAVVFCCLREFKGPRSVKHLSNHLSLYGISVTVDDIGTSELGRELRMLGLILDSPDAESGILLVPPFNLSGTGSN